MVFKRPFIGDSGEETAQLLIRSPRTEPFELVKFYMEDGLKMITY